MPARAYGPAAPPPTTLDCASLFPRCERRRLADLCGAFVEKTGRITRNVRGKLANWRLAVSHNCPACRCYRTPGMPGFGYAGSASVPLASMDGLRYQRAGMMHSYGMDYEQGERYEELTSRRPASSAYSRDIIRSLEELELNRIERRAPLGPPPYHHQSQQLPTRDAPRPYDAHLASSWSSERPYATLPKRSRAINLEDHFLPKDLQRLSRYPKSLQDLKYLEIEAILGRDPRPSTSSSVASTSYPPAPLLGERARFGRREDLSALDDRPPRSLGSRSSSRLSSREERRWTPRLDEEAQSQLFLEGLAGGSQIERYEPGKVHYEREYRIYGKDTVALIFYKTCYL